MPNKKVVFLASDYKPRPGGRAEYIDNLARGLRAIGINAKVVAVIQAHHREDLRFLQGYEEWVTPFEVNHDLRPRNLLGNKLISLLEIVRCISSSSRCVLERCASFRRSADSVRRLDRVLAKEEPNVVVFGHLDIRLYAMALYLRRQGIPYGIVVHGLEVPRRLDRLNDFMRRRVMLTGAKWLIANSHYSKTLLDVWRFPEDKVRVVNPAVAVSSGSQRDESGPMSQATRELTLVTLCRLAKGKGIDIVLRALKMLRSRDMYFRYLVGGEGDEKESLEALVEKLGLGGSVRFVGSVTGDQKWRLLHSGDVFVMPSRVEATWTESFGMAYVEAGACGLPVVGSKVGGVPEVIIDGVTGILVAEDAPYDLAEALAFLYQNPLRRVAMGAAGIERAKLFSPTVIAAEFRKWVLDDV